MTLLLHILRKDIRHFLPEILVNLALLTAFAWVEPANWTGDSSFGFGNPSLLAVLLRLLIPLGWLVMITRVLHDETLVGDRQFWITRPYPWPTLLAAKACFLLLFLHLPLFLMQTYMLLHAGFRVLPVLGRLLHFQAVAATVYVLPLAAISVVTASFGRQILTVLAGLIYAALVYAGALSVLSHNMPAPYLGGLAITLVVLTLVAVILAMYARRPLWPSRAALLVLPVAVALLALGLPTKFLVSRVYADTTPGSVLVFDSDPHQRQPLAGSGDPTDGKHDVLVPIPVQLHAKEPTQEATIRGLQFTLHASDGFTWTSPYQQSNTTLTNAKSELLSLLVPPEVYTHVQHQLTSVEMEAALEAFTFPTPDVLTIPRDSSLILPNHGHCAPNLNTDYLECRYALQTPPPMALSLSLQLEPCTVAGQREVVHRRTGGVLEGNTLDIDPVTVLNIPLFHEDEETHNVTDRQLCPGTQASFATERSLGLSHLYLTTPALNLAKFAVPRRSGSRAQTAR